MPVSFPYLVLLFSCWLMLWSAWGESKCPENFKPKSQNQIQKLNLSELQTTFGLKAQFSPFSIWPSLTLSLCFPSLFHWSRLAQSSQPNPRPKWHVSVHPLFSCNSLFFYSFLFPTMQCFSGSAAAASTREQVDGGGSSGKDAPGSVGRSKGRRCPRAARRQRKRSWGSWGSWWRTGWRIQDGIKISYYTHLNSKTEVFRLLDPVWIGKVLELKKVPSLKLLAPPCLVKGLRGTFSH